MALVKCPECGADGISDTASACPKCGANIKAYYDQLRYNQQVAEYKRLRAGQIPPPPIPKKLTAAAVLDWVIFALGVCLLLCFLICSTALLFPPRRSQPIDWFFLFIFLLFGGLGMGLGLRLLSGDRARYRRAMAWYEYALYNREAYVNEVLDEEIRQAQSRQAPRCPVCGSAHIWQFRTANRAVNVRAGLAGSNTGMQYQCTACGHKW